MIINNIDNNQNYLIKQFFKGNRTFFQPCRQSWGKILQLEDLLPPETHAQPIFALKSTDYKANEPQPHWPKPFKPTNSFDQQ